jgi:hypothetical protein
MTTMPVALTIIYWISLIAAGLNLVVSGLVFRRRRHVFPWLQKKLDPRWWAVSSILSSIAALSILIPRLANAPGLVILVTSLVGLACLSGAVPVSWHSLRTPTDAQHGSTATDAPEPDPGQPQQAI